jgi:ElaB/YqjD/DUF883 family membrane-anchored ribosome-binding protein
MTRGHSGSLKKRFLALFAESDHRGDETALPVEVIEGGQSPALAERMSAAVRHQMASIVAPLSESYERNVQLAHENGVLSERAAALERELQALRDSAAADRRALDETRKRLEAMEGANAALTRMLSTQADERLSSHPRPTGGLLWAFWTVLAVAVALAIMLVVRW